MSIYVQTSTFDLPGKSFVFDSLGDGSLIATDGTQVVREKVPGSRQFAKLCTIKSGSPTFLRVNPDFSKAAVGHYQPADITDKNVVVFRVSDCGEAKTFPVDNFDAEWLDNSRLAVTAEPPQSGSKAIAQVLDVDSGEVVRLVENAGAASGGITIDSRNQLFVGDGLSPGRTADATGQIKAYPEATWKQAMSSGVPIDFDATGVTVATILSAATLGFDIFGNLHVGGGNFATGDKGYVGIIAASAIQNAISGGPPVTPASPSTVLQKLDPSPAENFWLVNANRKLPELYLNDYSTQTVYVFKPC